MQRSQLRSLVAAGAIAVGAMVTLTAPIAAAAPAECNPADIGCSGTGTERATSVESAAKMKLKGIVTRRDADTFTVRGMNGVDGRP